MSNSTTEKERPNSLAGFDSSSENEAAPPSQPPHQQRRTRQKAAVYSKTSKKGSTNNKNFAPLDQLPVPSAVGEIANTVGNVPNGETDGQQPPGKGKSSALRLRLDLNLDIELELKAKIHGSLELTLL
jgi:hypothetical protein